MVLIFLGEKFLEVTRPANKTTWNMSLSNPMDENWIEERLDVTRLWKKETYSMIKTQDKHYIASFPFWVDVIKVKSLCEMEREIHK